MNTIKPPKVSFVIPLYKEASSIGSLVERLERLMEGTGLTWEWVLIDDGSPDDTWKAVQKAAHGRQNLHAARLSRNFGKESALIAGLKMARGDAVVVMDADLQHPPEVALEMIELWRSTGVPIVDAIKRSRQVDSLFKQLTSNIFYKLFNVMTGLNLTNYSDFKLLTRPVVKSLLSMEERNIFFRGLTMWIGYQRHTVAFDVSERGGGHSTFTLSRLLKLAIMAFTSFSTIPLQIVSIFGYLFLAFGLCLSVQTLWMKLCGRALSGFTTVILLQLIIGGLILISLSIIGHYIGRIYLETKRRPHYLIEEILSSKTDFTSAETEL